jgi:hypothetical protein
MNIEFGSVWHGFRAVKGMLEDEVVISEAHYEHKILCAVSPLSFPYIQNLRWRENCFNEEVKLNLL